MEFSEYIVYIFNFSLGVAAVLAFIMIVTAGINLLESRGNPSQIEEAKKKIINSLIGLAVLLTSYALLTTINPNIINIQNINLGGVNIPVPIINPVTPVEKVKNYEFEEIPLGTITEGILMGNSSKKNGLPCYEYEDDSTKIKDEDGRIIIGDTIDQNNDKVINSEDYLLNKDIFYCIKLLDNAIKNKTEYHLRELINQLDELLQTNCFCKNCYYPHLLSEPYDCAVSNCPAPCVPYKGKTCSNYVVGECSKCKSCQYFCGCCGNYEKGCEDAPGWSEDNKVNKSCKKTEVINCKRQEIKQLIDGSQPDEYCYKDGYISWWDEDNDNRGEVDQKLLSYQKSMQRMAYYKQYYIDEVVELEKAEAKMKDPYGERLSASELYNNVQNKENVSVTKTTYENYDISRYCQEANCLEYETQTSPEGVETYKYDQYGQRVCKKYDFNVKNRACLMEKEASESIACKEAKTEEERLACEEHYTYAGDGATFYYSSEYNTNTKQETTIIDQTDSKCDIEERNMDEEMYGGLIPIGETVDYTEAWGIEVARVIQTMINEVRSIASSASIISDFPTQCECSGNCTQEIPISCCSCPCYGEDCCPSKDCKEPKCTACEPKEKYKNDSCNEVSIIYPTGCYTCTGKRKPTYSSKSQAKPDYYVCPFKNMCSYVRGIYQIGGISNSCFLPSTTEDEEKAKEAIRGKIGYLARFQIREKMLFSLSGINISNSAFNSEPSALFPELDCLKGCDYKKPPENLTCDSTASQFSLNRFSLFSMLKASRERLTGCVNGYSYPRKETSDNVRVMSCYEGVNSGLTILPEFPYPDKSTEKSPYINCYPYNSNVLGLQDKEKCFYNINRTGDNSNPGCLTITKNYMDNYYCCQ